MARKLILLLTCVLVLKLSGQTNAYFLNNPVWEIIEADGSNFPCVKYTTYNYFTNGDTIIGAFTYKKIFTKGQGYYSWQSPTPGFCPNPPFTFNSGIPVFFLRSVGKKIYIKPFSNPDTLLYDFNLKVGDTLPPTYNNWISNVIKVTAIDSIFTLNGYMKRFHLVGCPNQYLIEGIGHSGGLSEVIGLSVNGSWNLNCYSQNNTKYFPSLATGGCMLPLGLNEFDNQHIVLKAFPNPSSGKFILTGLTRSEYENTEIKIFNMFGQEVEYTLSNINNNVKINFHATKGIYFVKVGTKTLKVINE